MAKSKDPQVITLSEPLRVLTPRQITQIDGHLADIEGFGRIVLIKRSGKLRFIEKTESVEATHPER
jgi:hypothetical protein